MVNQNQTDDDYSEDDFAEELSFDVEMPWLEEEPSWWERFISWLGFRKKPQTNVFQLEADTSDEEWDKRLAVAACIEAAISSTKWRHRELQEQAPRMVSFYVVNVTVRDRGNEGFWLYIEVKDDRNGTSNTLPLHEFFKTFSPIGDLTLHDYHS